MYLRRKRCFKIDKSVIQNISDYGSKVINRRGGENLSKNVC